jgi:hypothetical protein
MWRSSAPRRSPRRVRLIQQGGSQGPRQGPRWLSNDSAGSKCRSMSSTDWPMPSWLCVPSATRTAAICHSPSARQSHGGVNWSGSNARPLRLASRKDRRGGQARNGAADRSVVETFHQAAEGQDEPDKTRDKVGAALGMSGKTYEKARAVVEAAEEDAEEFSPWFALNCRDTLRSVVQPSGDCPRMKSSRCLELLSSRTAEKYGARTTFCIASASPRRRGSGREVHRGAVSEWELPLRSGEKSVSL